MSDADERDVDGLEGSIEVKIEIGELANTEFGVDFDDGMDFFAGVAVGLEAHFGFEEVESGGEVGFFRDLSSGRQEKSETQSAQS